MSTLYTAIQLITPVA